jgi:RNA polymerase sigma-70 factor (ECF subfamily)
MSDQEARFAELYRRYGKHLHAYCVRRTPGSQAADAVAETFLVAWRKIDRYPRGRGASVALCSRLSGSLPSMATRHAVED